MEAKVWPRESGINLRPSLDFGLHSRPNPLNGVRACGFRVENV